MSARPAISAEAGEVRLENLLTAHEKQLAVAGLPPADTLAGIYEKGACKR